MIDSELAQAGPDVRQRALDRAVTAFEQELKAAGIHLDPLIQLGLLELVEKIEALGSNSPSNLVSLSRRDEPLGVGRPVEEFLNRMCQDVA